MHGMNPPRSTLRTSFDLRLDKPSRWIVIGLFALVFAVFGTTLKQGFVSFDDDILVYENPLVREISPTTLRGIFTTYDPELYIPLTFFSYQIDHLIGGGSPFWFHLTNVIFHALNASLVFLFVRRLDGQHIPLAAACALLFAVHPLHTEAVAWISARKDQLATFFYLLSMLAYLRYVRSDKQRDLCGAFGFALIGILSKVTLITMPIVLLLLDFHENRRLSRKTVVEKIPFLLLSIAFGIIALWGKKDMLATSGTDVKILMAFKSSAFYLQKLLWPSHLSVVYPFDGDVRWWLPAFLVPILAVLAIGLLVFLNRKDRILVFCTAFFFVVTAPTFLNFAKAGEIFVASDRYAYLPSVAFFYLACSLARRAAARTGASARLPIRIGFACLTIALAGAAHMQARVWEDDRTFFTHALDYYPDSYVAQNNLGNALLIDKDYDGAIAAYEKALTINPESVRTIGNLALAYGRKGDIRSGFEAVASGLSIAPRSAELHMRLGDLHIMQKRFDEAYSAYAKAAELDPELLKKKYYAIEREKTL